MNELNEHRTFFLSYASEAREYAVRLKEHLVHQTYTVWFDLQDIDWGDNITDRLDEGIIHSFNGIIVISPNYLARTWTLYEFHRLREINKLRYIILHHTSHQNIISEHSDVYEVIRDLVIMNDSYKFLEISNQLKQILEDRVGERFLPLFTQLSTGKWKEADRTTFYLIRTEGLLNSPQEDLIKLDSLWRICSSGRYGFKIQQSIYEEAMRQSGNNYLKSCDCFYRRVAWSDLGGILNSSSSAKTPKGHFPNLVYFENELQGRPPVPSLDQEILKFRQTEVNFLSLLYTFGTLSVFTIIFCIILPLLSGEKIGCNFESTVVPLWALFGIIIYPFWWIFLPSALSRRRHRKCAHDLHKFFTNQNFISDIPHP